MNGRAAPATVPTRSRPNSTEFGARSGVKAQPRNNPPVVVNSGHPITCIVTNGCVALSD